MSQFARQAPEGPFAGGVVLEGHGDERGAIGVRDDAGDLSPGDEVLHVHIPDGAPRGKPPSLASCTMPFSISAARSAE